MRRDADRRGFWSFKPPFRPGQSGTADESTTRGRRLPSETVKVDFQFGQHQLGLQTSRHGVGYAEH